MYSPLEIKADNEHIASSLKILQERVEKNAR